MNIQTTLGVSGSRGNAPGRQRRVVAIANGEVGSVYLKNCSVTAFLYFDTAPRAAQQCSAACQAQTGPISKQAS